MALTFTQACVGFLHYQTAAGRSPYTLRNYRTTFGKMRIYFAADPLLADIDRGQIIDFMAWLQEDYISEPDGAAPRGQIKLSAKSILNIHADLSALWRWAKDEGYVSVNVIRTIEPPVAKSPVVDAYSQANIEALLAICDHKRTWKAPANTAMDLVADRDRAIILVLLDTGVRASELCGIRMADLDMANNRIRILGKGNKERFVFFGRRTAKALWRHVTPRIAPAPAEDFYLFTVGPVDDPRPLTRDVLRRLLARIGERAGVANVYPHRFRHTFAINYLRNGGDLFTLQELLGHSDLDMVRRYARIAQNDCARVHVKASPVDNWRL